MRTAIPVDALWPDYAIAIYDRLVTAAEKDSRIQNEPLLRLARIAPTPEYDPEKTQQLITRHLKKIGAVNEGSHLGRILWYTWMPVRILCAHNRSLISHPLLTEISREPFFDKRSLDKLLNLFPSPNLDILATLQRLAGHSTREIPAEAYIRSWPILAKLYHDLEYGW